MKLNLREWFFIIFWERVKECCGYIRITTP